MVDGTGRAGAHMRERVGSAPREEKGLTTVRSVDSQGAV